MFTIVVILGLGGVALTHLLIQCTRATVLMKERKTTPAMLTYTGAALTAVILLAAMVLLNDTI